MSERVFVIGKIATKVDRLANGDAVVGRWMHPTWPADWEGCASMLDELAYHARAVQATAIVLHQPPPLPVVAALVWRCQALDEGWQPPFAGMRFGILVNAGDAPVYLPG